MNTSKVAKYMFILFGSAFMSVQTFAESYKLGLSGTTSWIRTGFSTEDVTAPSIKITRAFGHDGDLEIGFFYSHLSVTTANTWINPGPIPYDGVTSIESSGKLKLDQICGYVRYKFNPLTERIIPYMAIAIGGVKVHEVGTRYIDGGFTGAETTKFSESDWMLSVIGNVGIEIPITNKLGCDLSVGYLFQNAPDRILYTELKGIQVSAGLSFAF